MLIPVLPRYLFDQVSWLHQIGAPARRDDLPFIAGV